MSPPLHPPQDLLPVDQTLEGDSDDDIFGGDSPRSDDDHVLGGSPGGTPASARSKAWELSEEEAEEQRSLAAGGYMGVRRVVRLLENGESTKKAVDAVVDACAQVGDCWAAAQGCRSRRGWPAQILALCMLCLPCPACCCRQAAGGDQLLLHPQPLTCRPPPSSPPCR